MADDKGSDLDIFEGLTKKKKTIAPGALESASPAGPSLAPPPAPSFSPPSEAAPRSLPPAKLPPPKKTLLGMTSPQNEGDAAPPSALPKPTLPPPSRKAPSAPPPPQAAMEAELSAEATAELRRPSKEEIQRLMAGDEPHASAAPPPAPPPPPPAAERAAELAAEPVPAAQADAHVPAATGSEPARVADSVPPEEVSAAVLEGGDDDGLSWDDEEESTSVFDKSHADELFGDMAGERAAHHQAHHQDSARPELSGAMALLAASNRPASIAPAAGMMPSIPASGMPSIPYDGALPKIPGPAPVPREIVDAVNFDSAPAPASSATRPPNAGWAPSVPAPMAAPAAKTASKTNLWLGLAAALVVGLALFLYLRSTGPGTLVVRVLHQGKPVDNAQVFVDGQQVCAFTPCRVKSVDPGKREVRAAFAQLVGQGSVEVKGGGGETELEIQLGAATGGAPTAPASSQPSADAAQAAALSMKTSLSEKVKVFVDGQEKGVLPLELKDLKPGNVTLRFEAAGDKYGKLEKTVALEPGKTLTLDDVKLPLKFVTVTFKLGTSGASVKLVQEGKPDTVLAFGGTSLDKKLDTTGTFKVVATMKGYRDFEQTIAFEEGKATQTVEVKLDKEEAAPAPTAEPAAASPAPQAAAPAADNFGTINANSLPPSSVLIDGRPHGQTPVTGVRVSAGSHTVVFKHKEFGVQSRGVTVTGGKAATVTVKFDTKGGDAPKKKKKSSDD